MFYCNKAEELTPSFYYGFKNKAGGFSLPYVKFMPFNLKLELFIERDKPSLFNLCFKTFILGYDFVRFHGDYLKL